MDDLYYRIYKDGIPLLQYLEKEGKNKNQVEGNSDCFLQELDEYADIEKIVCGKRRSWKP